MRRKLYRDNKYCNRRMNVKRKVLKRVVLGTAFGAIVIVATNMIPLNTVKADDEIINNDIHIETIDNGDSIDFKNVDYLIDDNTIVSNVNEKISISNPFNVGNSPDKKMVIDFLASPDGQYIYKYAEEYGVDPNIMAAIAMQETTLNHYACIPGGDMYSGYGVGLMQLESPSGEEIKAFNYNTNEWDTEYVTMDNACDIEKNIKIGCMMFQNKLKENGGNIFLAIQSHNYGQGMIDMMMDNLYGEKAREVKSDYRNISWIDEVKNIHNNPGMYLSNWAESGYGDGDYLEHILRFCPSKEAKFKMGGFEYTIDLEKCQLKDKYEYGTAIKK